MKTTRVRANRFARRFAVVAAAVAHAACGTASPREAKPSHPSTGTTGCADDKEHEHDDPSVEPANTVPTHAHANADEWKARLEGPDRDAWQLPEEVLRVLDLQPSMTVADVGAGTGYFAVKLARAVPQGQVIATDLEPDMVRFLEERARQEELPNLRAALATHSASGLATQSVDTILVVHVWHHVHDRKCYARDLAAALRPGGKLLVVDFSPDAHRGPPADMRLSPEAVIADFAGAGLTATLSAVQLPDQYIVEARRER